MKAILRYLICSAGGAALLTTAGCSSLPVQTHQAAGTALYPPTDPATVQILRQAPTRPYVKLGEITAEPQSTRTPLSETEARLRTVGAKMGADAVVIVVETTLTKAAVTRGVWDSRLSSDIGQVFVAVPIRYTAPLAATRSMRR